MCAVLSHYRLAGNRKNSNFHFVDGRLESTSHGRGMRLLHLSGAIYDSSAFHIHVVQVTTLPYVPTIAGKPGHQSGLITLFSQKIFDMLMILEVFDEQQGTEVGRLEEVCRSSRVDEADHDGPSTRDLGQFVRAEPRLYDVWIQGTLILRVSLYSTPMRDACMPVVHLHSAKISW